MEDLQFYILFNSISVISRQWTGDIKRLCAMEPSLPLNFKHLSQVVLEKKSFEYFLCISMIQKQDPWDGPFWTRGSSVEQT